MLGNLLRLPNSLKTIFDKEENMSEITQIMHKGKTIFFADHKGSQGSEVIRAQKSMLEMIKNSGVSDALSITDMTDVRVPRELDEEMRRLGNSISRYSKKVAIIGMSQGAKFVIINAAMRITNKPIKLFDTVEDAKEWLVSD
jgi:hypothetical protein